MSRLSNSEIHMVHRIGRLRLPYSVALVRWREERVSWRSPSA
ncbi:hypothetical protein PEL8287_01498 [Roseovarius litorisediminis]|uniref:Uncharacterized protein n=1 Tax=Roseovarius litorisediminis TaxID=1312363 RepID=A0A1Y5S5X7_9RHOB|nr:hypothetical protein PEL8287_01498 [Roseovarius litorisediminis]